MRQVAPGVFVTSIVTTSTAPPGFFFRLVCKVLRARGDLLVCCPCRSGMYDRKFGQGVRPTINIFCMNCGYPHYECQPEVGFLSDMIGEQRDMREQQRERLVKGRHP